MHGDNIAHLKKTSNHNCFYFTCRAFANIAHLKKTSNHNQASLALTSGCNIAHLKKTSNHNSWHRQFRGNANIAHLKKTSNHNRNAATSTTSNREKSKTRKFKAAFPALRGWALISASLLILIQNTFFASSLNKKKEKN